MTKYSTSIPTAEELYALEAAARRLRAKVVSDMFRSAISALKSLFASRAVRHA